MCWIVFHSMLSRLFAWLLPLFFFHAEDGIREGHVTGVQTCALPIYASAQDLLIRWHRMRDFNALWQPGYDHAGIALQAVMVRRLADEGLTLQDVGRERFVEICWEFIRDYGGQIMEQLRTMGASLDYRRHRFTMDDAYARAVMGFFVHLSEKGYLFRATRIVNWCPGCASTVSDLEVD